jgi:hypothetical protein
MVAIAEPATCLQYTELCMNVKDRPWTISPAVLWDRARYDERVDLLARL